jgi:predicted Fe-Mo cluster-binding NifX family protein
MNKKIAVPIENGILTTHFGHAREFSLTTIENNQILKEEILVPPPHEPGVIPKWLGDIGATDILAGGMGQQAIQLFLNNNISVYVGVEQKAPAQLVEDLINDRLQSGGNYCTH